LGAALGGQRRFAEAEAELREAIRLNGRDGMFHADLAVMLLAQGKRPEAIEVAQAALRLGYREHWVYRALGLVGKADDRR
jgi:Flp pilus assembly protein TadD